MNQWQPIDTAPKCVPVLVYMAGTAGLGIYRAILADWSDGRGERWRPTGYTALDEFPVSAEIINWQQLPPSPPEAR